MFRKSTLALFAAAALCAVALAPSAASARGGGWSGSRSGGSFHVHARGLGTRFIGPAVQKDHRHHRHGIGFGFFGPGYVNPTYAAYGYPDERCYVVRRVRTPVGYRLRIINLCV